jgi:TonB-dependent receptor
VNRACWTLICIGILSTALYSLACAATLHGVVKDQRTFEPVIGAIVKVKGAGKGARTGLDGSFTIRNTSDSVLQLRIIGSGYAALDTSVIAVKTGQEDVVEILLSPISFEGHELTVLEKVDHGSDVEAQHREQNSKSIVSAVSARTIEVSPDLSVANVSQRIAGVSVTRTPTGDGQHAIIRGMDKRYNYTTVNGIKIPSPDPKNRYVPLDIFPSELLDRLEVTKNLLPSMEGDAIGGALNMVLKQAPDREELSIKVGSGFSGLFSGGRKFTAIDFQGESTSPPARNGSGYLATINDFPLSNFNPYAQGAGPNQYYSLTYGNRFLEDEQLGIVVSGTYQRTYRGANSLFFPSTASQITSLPVLTDVDNRYYSTLLTRIGVMSNVDYVVNDHNHLELFGMFADLGSQEVRDEYDSVLGLSWPQLIRVAYSRRATVENQRIGNITLTGDHNVLGTALEVNWHLAYSRASLDQPDRSELDLYGGVDLNPQTNSYTPEPWIVQGVSPRRWTNTVDQDKSAYLNLKSTVDLFGLATEFDYGGMYRAKTRTNKYDAYELKPLTKYTTQYYNGNVFLDTFIVFNPQGSSTDPLNYDAHENVSAGFAQFTIQTGNLQTVGGVRFEHTDFGWTSKAPTTFVGQSGSIGYLDLLPSIAFKYSPSAEQNWRLSYFESISRPGFYEVIPNEGVSGEDYTENTNDSLNRTHAFNVDARWEYFSSGLDHLLIGAFYKNIQDPIEYTVAEVLTNSYLVPKNWGTATNFGLEIDFRKYVSNFGIAANYTFTSSQITTDKRVNFRSGDSVTGMTTFRVESQTRPLQGQSAHIANLSLLYKDFDLGMDAQIGVVYNSESIVGVSPFKDNDIWQKGIAQLDFSGEQRLFGNVVLYLKITNILNTPREEVIHQAYTQGAAAVGLQVPGQDLIVRREYYDRTYLLGVKLKW